MIPARATRPCIVVAPFFPPSGLPPSHRARLFVRHLEGLGWTPIVITVDPRDREEPQEPALEQLVSPAVRVERVRALPARLTRWFGIGDIALRALPQLAVHTVRAARARPGCVVLLIVPPWYGLWLVPLLRHLTAAALVVDYVDPWRVADTGTVKSRLSAWLAERTEGWCMGGVDGVFAVSEHIVNDVRRRYPWIRDAATGAAPYGFESSDLELATRSGPARAPALADSAVAGPGGWEHPFRLVYVGALSDAQLPVLATLLDAMALLRAEDPTRARRVRLELYGTTYAPPSMATARTATLVAARGLGAQVVERPARVPYADALTLAATADANLVLGDTTTYYAASKLMPVLAARRPVVALLQAGSEPARVLGRLGARGLVCYGPGDPGSCRATVRQAAEALRGLTEERIPVVTADLVTDPALGRRTAAAMTAALAAVLDGAAARRTPTV